MFVVTNQSGIARGLYSEGDFWALHERMLADLAMARADEAMYAQKKAGRAAE